MLTLPRKGELSSDQIQHIYEYWANKRTVFLYGEIIGFPERVDPASSGYVADVILTLSDVSDEPIRLFIDSPGGSVASGLALYDIIKSVRAPIYTFGRNCASMAAIVLSAGEKGHRYLFPNCKTMLHLPAVYLNMRQDSREAEILSKEINKIKDTLVDILVENGVTSPKKKILKDIDREYWMDAQESINYGLADRIIEKGTL